VLEFPGKLKLNTITDPGVVLPASLWKEILAMLRLFGSSLGYAKVGSALPDLPEIRFFPLTKSTPVLAKGRTRVSYSPGALFASARLLRDGPL